MVLAHGVRGLRIISAGFAFYAYGMTFTQALNGAGATWAPTWLNGLCFWAFELPLAWVLAVHVGLETTGAFVACLAAFSLLAVASGAVFRRGAWKRVDGLTAAEEEPASPVARHCASSHQGAGLKPVRRSRARGPAWSTPRPERRRLDFARSRHHLLSPRRAKPILSCRPRRRNVSCDCGWHARHRGRQALADGRPGDGRAAAPEEEPMAGWTTEVTLDVAWGEMDALGHVNNVRYIAWAETARIAFFEKLGMSTRPEDPVGPILARIENDYLEPVEYPARVTVGIRPERVGNTSLTLAHEIWIAGAPGAGGRTGTGGGGAHQLRHAGEGPGSR